MYTSYRQQYVFGFPPFELKDVSASSSLFLGTEVGGKSTAAGCVPIDLKADKQMKYLKMRLDIKVLEPLAGSGATGTITFFTCGDNAGAADTSNAVELFSLPVSTAAAIASSTAPWFEITVPSNCKQYIYAEVAVGSTAFTGGKLLIQMNPNL